MRTTEKSKNATSASFSIAHLLAKKRKPFQDSELLKEAFLAGAEFLFERFANKCQIILAINDLQLFDNTVTRRFEAIAGNMETQLKDDLEICEWFSLQFDESTDISDTSQLAIILRMVFSDFSIKEELLKILPMKMRTRGEDVYNAFKLHATKVDLLLNKLSAVITDRAPAMTGKTNGFVALFKKDESFPKLLLSYHCIIHQEALCGKILPFSHVMNVVTSIMNSIWVAPLRHHLFKSLLEDIGDDDKPNDPILHSEVCWLSRGKVLSRFLSLIKEIKTFLAPNVKEFNKHGYVDNQESSLSLLDLAFLTDVNEKLNS